MISFEARTFPYIMPYQNSRKTIANSGPHSNKSFLYKIPKFPMPTKTDTICHMFPIGHISLSIRIGHVFRLTLHRIIFGLNYRFYTHRTISVFNYIGQHIAYKKTTDPFSGTGGRCSDIKTKANGPMLFKREICCDKF